MKLVVKDKQERIDKYLQEHLDKSRSEIQKMIEKGFILVNDQKVKNNYIVKLDDLIKIKEDYQENSKIMAEDIKLDIVYEDQDLMIINKPSGIVVHPGSGNKKGTIVNALLHYTENLSDKSGEDRYGIVHRLDKDTSGLMVIAKNNKIHELLSKMFQEKSINREYIALLIGELKTETATIDAPIGRDITDRKKMTVTEKNSKKAITHLKVLKIFKDYTLVKLKLETGRTHQIRVHLKYIGYPIYNDPVYTNNKTNSFGQFLHSAVIDFIHPISKKHLHFEADLPLEMQTFINDLK